jgi:TRAP-type mannitol/chloroaromatic compound transport system permease large subunit
MTTQVEGEPEISTAHIYRGVAPFIIIQLISLTLVYVFPEIATWLPRQAYSQ